VAAGGRMLRRNRPSGMAGMQTVDRLKADRPGHSNVIFLTDRRRFATQVSLQRDTI